MGAKALIGTSQGGGEVGETKQEDEMEGERDRLGLVYLLER